MTSVGTDGEVTVHGRWSFARRCQGTGLPAWAIAAAVAALLSFAGCGGMSGTPSGNTSGATAASNSPEISVTPSPVSFGNVAVGSNSSVPMNVSNQGSAALTITNIVTSGAGFSISGLPVPLTLGVGNSQAFAASFQPAAVGNSSGSIAFTNNATSGAYLVDLNGAGVAAPPPGAHSVALSWTASTSNGVSGYNVYRGPVSGGPYAVVSSSLVAATQYTDSTVQSAQTYFYVVTAVDSNNAESAYSNEVSAAIP